MKKVVLITLFLPILLISQSCKNLSKDVSVSEDPYSFNFDRALINNLITAFDKTIKEGYELKSAKSVIDEERLKQIFLNHLSNLGIATIPAVPQNYSNQYFTLVQNIALASNFSNEEDFITHLKLLQETVIHSTLLNNLEIQDILNKSEFMIQLIEWLKNNQELFQQDIKKCTGWWSCWGKCVAGIAGGAITGGLGGAAAGSVIPILGTGWGGLLGAIGGGLTGAATFCD